MDQNGDRVVEIAIQENHNSEAMLYWKPTGREPTWTECANQRPTHFTGPKLGDCYCKSYRK